MLSNNQIPKRDSANLQLGNIEPAPSPKYAPRTDRRAFTKTLTWKIEEFKQNQDEDKPLSTTTKSFWQAKQLNASANAPATEQKHPHHDAKKKNSSKSQKTMRLPADQTEQECYNRRQPQTWALPLSPSFLSQKQKAKILAQQTGLKTDRTDLTATYSYKKDVLQLRDYLRQMPRMKSSKSERRIHTFDGQLNTASTKQEQSRFPYKSLEIPDKIVKKQASVYQKNSKLIQKQLSSIPLSIKNSTYNYDSPKIHTSKSYKRQKQELSPFNTKNNINYYKQTELKIPKLTDHKTTRICLSDFVLGKCKGEGAFGQVFIALHSPTRMLVAIKKIPKQKVRYMLEQFIQQIKIQMFLNHPNIVKLYGFFDDPTHFYIIMEYMEAGNLFAIIKKNKSLSEEETAERLKEVCLGLQQMHKNSILHRDIKPENVVLTNDVCKLCDFGWAAVCKDRRTTYCGTLDYVSPEIIEGEGYDDSVDIWCIGVLAYQMICGKPPFYNISRQQTMKRIANASYEYPPDVSACAKSFIDRILKRNPSDRIDISEILGDQFFR